MIGCSIILDGVTYHGCLNRWAKRREEERLRFEWEKSSRLWQGELEGTSPSSSPPVAALKMSVSDFSPVPAGMSTSLDTSRTSKGNESLIFLETFSSLNSSQSQLSPNYTLSELLEWNRDGNEI